MGGEVCFEKYLGFQIEEIARLLGMEPEYSRKGYNLHIIFEKFISEYILKSKLIEKDLKQSSDISNFPLDCVIFEKSFKNLNYGPYCGSYGFWNVIHSFCENEDIQFEDE